MRSSAGQTAAPRQGGRRVTASVSLTGGARGRQGAAAAVHLGPRLLGRHRRRRRVRGGQPPVRQSVGHRATVYRGRRRRRPGGGALAGRVGHIGTSAAAALPGPAAGGRSLAGRPAAIPGARLCALPCRRRRGGGGAGSPPGGTGSLPRRRAPGPASAAGAASGRGSSARVAGPAPPSPAAGFSRSSRSAAPPPGRLVAGAGPLPARGRPPVFSPGRPLGRRALPGIAAAGGAGRRVGRGPGRSWGAGGCDGPGGSASALGPRRGRGSPMPPASQRHAFFGGPAPRDRRPLPPCRLFEPRLPGVCYLGRRLSSAPTWLARVG